MSFLVRHWLIPTDDRALLPGPYLNASRIPALPGSVPNASACIASQAPLPATLGSFFHHLCAENVTTLVNLTPLTERGMVKSHAYWPSDPASPLRIDGSWEVRLLWEKSSTEDAAHGLIWRRLHLAHADATSHELTLLHYTGWQDHNALPTQQINALLTAVEEAHGRSPPTSPLWVHCSAGIGRSGTLIGAFLAQQLSHSSGDSMELAVHITEYMRQFRMGMVQMPGQLVTLAEAIESRKHSS